MDREEIERQDFPTVRRGYDPAAVHEHLRRAAERFDALAARPPAASLADGASTQVRAILEAAESSAQALRDDAAREASAHVERVADAAHGLLAKVDDLQAELDRLLSGLRSAARSLTGSLDELRRDATALSPAARAASPVAEAAHPPAGEAQLPTGDARPPTEAQLPAGNGARSADEAGARLVALNMALEGAPREQAAGYLDEHFALDDVDALLDAVYTSAGR